MGRGGGKDEGWGVKIKKNKIIKNLEKKFAKVVDFIIG